MMKTANGHQADSGALRAAGDVVRDLATIIPQLSRYTIVSVVALAIDMSGYMLLVTSGMKASLAGIAGYLTGLVVHYVLSSWLVFDIALSAKSTFRRAFEFFLSGLVGVILTAGIIAVATEWLHVAPLFAKIAAVAVSFVAVFVLRRSVVFAAPSHGLQIRPDHA